MKLIIFDKDGTLVCPRSGGKWVQSPGDQELLPGVQEKLDRLRGDGVEMAIASNDDRVAAGLKSLESMIDEFWYTLKLTGIEYAVIAPSDETDGIGLYVDLTVGFSPMTLTHPHRRYRKPSPGMLQYLVEQSELNLESYDDVLYVGDRPEDEQAAANAGVAFTWAKDFF